MTKKSTAAIVASPATPVTTTEHRPTYSCTPSAKLLYCRTIKRANLALSRLYCGPLGFDMEWRPKFEKGVPENPVALVQLATTDTVYLIQVSAMEAFPEKLRDVLENPDIVKTGVGIQSDAMKLHTDYAVSIRGCVDLSLLARSVDNSRWKGRYANAIALARLVDVYANQTLPKTRSIRTSDWQALLNPQQLEYAANDAHAGLTVYNHLSVLLSTASPVPNDSCFSFDCIRGRLCYPSGAYWLPYNPEYDPGPPPPPKSPKQPDDSDAATLPEVSKPMPTVNTTDNGKSKFVADGDRFMMHGIIGQGL